MSGTVKTPRIEEIGDGDGTALCRLARLNHHNQSAICARDKSHFRSLQLSKCTHVQSADIRVSSLLQRLRPPHLKDMFSA